MEKISLPGAARNLGAYSPAIKFGDFVMLSGQVPMGPHGSLVSGTIEEETRQTLDNMKNLLQAAGARLDQVVKCTCYLADIKDFDGFNKVYREFFGEHLPARTTLQAGLKGFKVEVDAMAYIGK